MPDGQEISRRHSKERNLADGLSLQKMNAKLKAVQSSDQLVNTHSKKGEEELAEAMVITEQAADTTNGSCLERILLSMSSKYSLRNGGLHDAILSTDASVLGFKDPIMQRRYDDYLTRENLPLACDILLFYCFILFLSWALFGAVQTFIVPGYSFLFHTGPCFCIILLDLIVVCLWKRGILDVYWQWIIVLLFVASSTVAIITCGSGENLMAMQNYLTRESQHDGKSAAHIFFQWLEVPLIVVHWVLAASVKINFKHMVVLYVLSSVQFLSYIYGYGMNTELVVEFVIVSSLGWVFGVTFLTGAYYHEKAQQSQFLRLNELEERVTTLHHRSSRLAHLQRASVTQLEVGVMTDTMDSMVTDGVLREVYYKANSSDPAEAQAAQAQLKYFLKCVDNVLATTAATAKSPAKASQDTPEVRVMRRLQTAGTALRIADQWFNKLRLSEYEERVRSPGIKSSSSAGRLASASGRASESNSVDAAVDPETASEYEVFLALGEESDGGGGGGVAEASMLLDQEGFSYSTDESKAEQCQIFLYDLDALKVSID
jgi:hypothetical protein